VRVTSNGGSGSLRCNDWMLYFRGFDSSPASRISRPAPAPVHGVAGQQVRQRAGLRFGHRHVGGALQNAVPGVGVTVAARPVQPWPLPPEQGAEPERDGGDVPGSGPQQRCLAVPRVAYACPLRQEWVTTSMSARDSPHRPCCDWTVGRLGVVCAGNGARCKNEVGGQGIIPPVRHFRGLRLTEGLRLRRSSRRRLPPWLDTWSRLNAPQFSSQWP
jgi:hypothetical protein